MFILLHVNVLAKQARVVSLHCNECNLSFKVKADKMRHDRAIHYQQNFDCKICKKTFNRVQNLERHMKFCNEIFQGETKCTMCNVKFRNTSIYNGISVQDTTSVENLYTFALFVNLNFALQRVSEIMCRGII